MGLTVIPPGGGEVVGDKPGRRVEILSDRDPLHATLSRFGPGMEGADLHVHHHHTDFFYVLEGELTVRLGVEDRQVRVSAGSLAWVPPDDVRRHPGEVAGAHPHLLVLGAQPHRQLALEHVEEVRVVLMHVQVRALHPGTEARQRRVHRIAVGQDLYAASRLVTDDLAPAGRNHSQAHCAETNRRRSSSRSTASVERAIARS